MNYFKGGDMNWIMENLVMVGMMFALVFMALALVYTPKLGMILLAIYLVFSIFLAISVIGDIYAQVGSMR